MTISDDTIFGNIGKEEVLSTDLCEWEKTPDPCTIVIFGASGDLTYRKLMPALYNLFSNGCVPEKFCVVGAGRTDMSDDAFRIECKRVL